MAYLSDDLLTLILGGTPSDYEWVFGDNDLFIDSATVGVGAFRFSNSALVANVTRTLSVQDSDYILAGTNITQSFTAKQEFPLQSSSFGPMIEIDNTITSGASGGISSGILNISPVISDAASGVGTIRCIRINPSVANLNDASLIGLGMNLTGNDNGFGSGSSVMSGLDFIVNFDGAGSLILERGVTGIVRASGGGSVTSMFASENALNIQNSSSVATGTVVNAKIAVSGASASMGETTVFGSTSVVVSTAGAVIDNLYHFKATNSSGAGTVNNQYGLHIANLTDATTNWAIYSLGGQSSHLGPFKFGANTTATHRLDIAAGTTTIAPIKLTSATPITTPIAGCLEFDTDTLYFTITTGTERRTIAFSGAQPNAPGSFTIATERYIVMSRRLKLTTTQRATIAGTGRLRIT